MPTEQQIREALQAVADPASGRPITDAGIVRQIDVHEDAVLVVLDSQEASLRDAVGALLARLPDVGRVDVRMPNAVEPGGAAPSEGIPFGQPGNRTSVIGVSSGKGGVGKSTVTANLAAALASAGHSVGVLDADIWGFSIPRMFGLRGERPVAFNGRIMPLESNGVKVISIGFFLEREEEPVVWRGPMLHKALEQFLADVHWGDPEFLLIDLPPGTGDITLSLSTFVPSMGMVVVTTPQPVAQKVAERAANMSGKVRLRTLGVIENMSGLKCDHCGQLTPIFGEGGGQRLAETLDVPLLAQIPLVSRVRELSDAGRPYVWEHPDDEVTAAYTQAAKSLTSFRPRRRLKIL